MSLIKSLVASIPRLSRRKQPDPAVLLFNPPPKPHPWGRPLGAGSGDYQKVEPARFGVIVVNGNRLAI